MCKENLLFYDAFNSLEESILAEYDRVKEDEEQSMFCSLDRFSMRDASRVNYYRTCPQIEITEKWEEEFMALYTDFIIPGAVNEINLSDKVRRKIMDSISKEDKRIFK